MQIRLPGALAALGVALLLSSIEAEGKMLTYPMASETAEFKKGKDSHLLLLLALSSLHFSRGWFLFFRETPSSSDVSFPELSASPLPYSAVYSPRACLCSVLSTLPPTLSPSLRTSSLDRAAAASSSTRRMPEVGYQEAQNTDVLTGSAAHHLGRDCDLGDNMK